MQVLFLCVPSAWMGLYMQNGTEFREGSLCKLCINSTIYIYIYNTISTAIYKSLFLHLLIVLSFYMTWIMDWWIGKCLHLSILWLKCQLLMDGSHNNLDHRVPTFKSGCLEHNGPTCCSFPLFIHKSMYTYNNNNIYAYYVIWVYFIL